MLAFFRALLVGAMTVWVGSFAAPAPASAHTLHVHVGKAQPAKAHQSFVSERTGAATVAYATSQSDTHHDHTPLSGCADQDCCVNGHCGGCCGVISPKTPMILGGSIADPLRDRNTAPPSRPLADAPSRPPNSFV